MTAPPAILEARAVSKIYRPGTAFEIRALDGISIAIPAGAFTVLTGPSGSGKTTLLALLGALDRPSAGTIHFAGRDLTACSDAERTRIRRRIGFVFQDAAFIHGLSVRENVAYPLIPLGIGRRERLRRADELLARFGVADRGNALPRVLSSGELQRAALARALVGNPEAVLADEPTSNLDGDSGSRVADALRELAAAGVSVVVASHDPMIARLAACSVELLSGR